MHSGFWLALVATILHAISLVVGVAIRKGHKSNESGSSW